MYFVCSLVLAASVLFAPAVAVAQIQPGSAGGTIGKHEKSISGDEEQPKAKNPTSPKATGCGKIVGTWTWHYLVTTETVFRSDGSGSNSTGQTSSWTCSGGMVIARWDVGAVEHIKISGDGNKLSISIVNCGTAPLCTLGATFPAERK